MLTAHVITLERREDRRTRFLGWNHKHGIDWRWAWAVDGRSLERATLQAQGILAPDHRYYTEGAIGNALSHRGQWQACVEEGLPRLIFEDDACARHGFAEHAARLVPHLEHCDLIFLGYNTDAPLMARLPGELITTMSFSPQARAETDRFYAFSHTAGPMRLPALYPCLLAWGVLGYAISPAGAARLLDVCFPLSSEPAIRVPYEKRTVYPRAIDGMINAALQRGTVRALACVPPLVIGPNGDSDVSPA